MVFSNTVEKGTLRLENLFFESDINVSTPNCRVDEYSVRIVFQGNPIQLPHLFEYLQPLVYRDLGSPYDGRWTGLGHFKEKGERVELFYHPKAHVVNLTKVVVLALRSQMVTICNLRLSLRSKFVVEAGARSYVEELKLPPEGNGALELPRYRVMNGKVQYVN